MTQQRRSTVGLIGAAGLLAAVAITVADAGGSDKASDAGASSDQQTTAPATGTPRDSAGTGSSDREPTATASATGPASAATSAPATRPDAAGAGAAPYCGASRYAEEITVQRWAGGDFRISLWPTDAARHADDRDGAVSEMWAAINRCVGTLDSAVTESLQDQLRCHEFLALVPGSGEERYATGTTFDIESWRPTPGRRRWISTRCGNTLGTDPTTTPMKTYRPDGVPPRSQPTGEHA
ncbi:DUF2599 domain-containing protein [Parafrankia sp. CH37]|uniref:DUF2599 domain-containing protein n=1 Tax=Parafrankia sp. CH37 TaxID=683308 RepID=UPI000B86917B|nr:DUF2599 domain-containing protein [Parafrankia sp. CH37]MBE3203367.1 DUF2599 domain-containing protein [Parafrankia sp. CH37]